jgi:hypothetical protein
MQQENAQITHTLNRKSIPSFTLPLVLVLEIGHPAPAMEGHRYDTGRDMADELLNLLGPAGLFADTVD